jgi:hypothetical protein
MSLRSDAVSARKSKPLRQEPVASSSASLVKTSPLSRASRAMASKSI